MYYYKNDYDRAISDFNEAIRLDPNFAMAYYNRGNAYFFKEDYKRAIADWESTLLIDPNNSNARKVLELVKAKVKQ
jgi:tetratricopeptide (TPR) repeat protein